MTTPPPDTPPIRLGILISGRGSNMESILTAIDSGQISNAEVVLVISNKSDAAGLERAASRGIATQVVRQKDHGTREQADQAIAEALKAAKVDWLIMAGFNRIITAPLLEAFPQHILNIHPSLLPAYGGPGMVGMNVHRAVVEDRQTQSGCTVHLVTADVDGGPMLGQAQVSIQSGDTAEEVAARVLTQEHQLYPKMVQWVLQHGPVPSPYFPQPVGS